MRKIFSPKNIPLHYFYMAWKKARHYAQSNFGIFDPVEIADFEINLDNRLQELRKSFESTDVQMCETVSYLLPKSPKTYKRFRPMVQFSIRDQVAWAVVVLALSEWFDTNEKIGELFPIHETKMREVYKWMVPWSYNNRLKRMFQKSEFDGGYERLYIHYNDKSLYESFQWSLRNLRERRIKEFEKVLNIHEKAFYGEADIKEFYPTLQREHVLNALNERFQQLLKAGVMTVECVEQWNALLKRMFEFRTDFTGIIEELRSHDALEDFQKSLLTESDGSEEKIQQKLNSSLPIGLIASGFLSNCVLTVYLDIPMNEFLLKQTSGTIHHASITRYTDDMMIISSDSEIIMDSMHQIKKLLGNIGLHLAEDKVIPALNGKYVQLSELKNQLECLKKSPELNEFLEKSIKDLKEKERPNFVSKRDRIPGSTAVIEKLSQFGESSLWAMNHNELDDYIRELLKLIETTFEEKEIKDETKVAFSAWRVRRGIAETAKRMRPFTQYDAKTRLRRAVEKYPFKVSLIDYYIMHLFDIAAEEEIEKELTSFLEQFGVSYKDSERFGAYGSYLRTRVLLALTDNWSLLPYEKRSPIKGILFRAVMNWYKQPPVWHEKQGIYRMFTVTNIMRDPGVIQANRVNSELVTAVKEAYGLFNLNLRDSKHFHENSEVQRQLSAARLKVLLDKFKQRRLKEEWARNLLLPEEETFITWAWVYFQSLHLTEQEADQWLDFSMVLAKHSIKDIPEKTFYLWLRLQENSIGEKSKYELLELLDIVIEDWSQYQHGNSHVKRFANALKDPSKIVDGPTESLAHTTATVLFAYTKQRLRNISRIKQALCMETNGLKLLPNDWKSDFIQDHSDRTRTALNDVEIPLIDWLTAISTSVAPDKAGLINPLSEFEVLSLVERLSKKLIEDGSEASGFITVRKLTISLNEWSNWRESVRNKKKPAVYPQFALSGYPEHIDPESKRLHGINEYLESFIKNMPVSDQASFQADHQDFIHCLALSVLILQMLSRKRNASDYLVFSNLFQWHSIQQIITEGCSPSTNVSTLLVSTLNMLLLIYQAQYHELGALKLPYKAMSSQNTITLQEYSRRIQEQLESASTNYLVWSKGVLEMISVDLDLLANDGRMS